MVIACLNNVLRLQFGLGYRREVISGISVSPG